MTCTTMLLRLRVAIPALRVCACVCVCMCVCVSKRREHPSRFPPSPPLNTVFSLPPSPPDKCVSTFLSGRHRGGIEPRARGIQRALSRKKNLLTKGLGSSMATTTRETCTPHHIPPSPWHLRKLGSRKGVRHTIIHTNTMDYLSH